MEIHVSKDDGHSQQISNIVVETASTLAFVGRTEHMTFRKSGQRWQHRPRHSTLFQMSMQHLAEARKPNGSWRAGKFWKLKLWSHELCAPLHDAGAMRGDPDRILAFPFRCLASTTDFEVGAT